MIELSKEALLTVGGIAVFVVVFMQMFLKPGLKKFKEQGWYDLVLNAVAVALGVGGAVAAQAAIGPLQFATAFDAVLIGLSGAALAVLGYEGAKNALGYLGK